MNKIEIREIKIPFKQWETDGILYLPKKEGKFPIVVFSHGYNGYKMDFDETAKSLAEHGIASVCCTFCGGSARDISGMPTTDMTIFSEMENLEAVLAYVKQLEQEGKAIVIAPSDSINIGRFEKKKENLDMLYQMGVQDVEMSLRQLQEVL